MTNRAAMAWLAGALLMGALIAGFVPVHANGVACGAAFSSGDKIAAVSAQYGDDLADIYAGRVPDNTVDYAAACEDRRGTQLAFVVPLLVIGALGGGFLLLTARKTEVPDQVSRAT